MLFRSESAEPNEAHRALARLEQQGNLAAIITQNIDNLHQKGGSSNVIEYHGNAAELRCPKCDSRSSVNDYNLKNKEIPRCNRCNQILKPEVILFGEMIPERALVESHSLASYSDLVLVIGTSAMVYPAAAIPAEAKQHGALVIE